MEAVYNSRKIEAEKNIEQFRINKGGEGFHALDSIDNQNCSIDVLKSDEPDDQNEGSYSLHSVRSDFTHNSDQGERSPVVSNYGKKNDTFEEFDISQKCDEMILSRNPRSEHLYNNYDDCHSEKESSNTESGQEPPRDRKVYKSKSHDKMHLDFISRSENDVGSDSKSSPGTLRSINDKNLYKNGIRSSYPGLQSFREHDIIPGGSTSYFSRGSYTDVSKSFSRDANDNSQAGNSFIKIKNQDIHKEKNRGQSNECGIDEDQGEEEAKLDNIDDRYDPPGEDIREDHPSLQRSMNVNPSQDPLSRSPSIRIISSSKHLSPKFKRSKNWSRIETTVLLKELGGLIKRCGNQRREAILRSNSTFEELSKILGDIGYERDAQACLVRWRNVLRIYKTQRRSVLASGGDITKYPFSCEIEDIYRSRIDSENQSPCEEGSIILEDTGKNSPAPPVNNFENESSQKTDNCEENTKKRMMHNLGISNEDDGDNSDENESHRYNRSKIPRISDFKGGPIKSSIAFLNNNSDLQIGNPHPGNHPSTITNRPNTLRNDVQNVVRNYEYGFPDHPNRQGGFNKDQQYFRNQIGRYFVSKDHQGISGHENKSFGNRDSEIPALNAIKQYINEISAESRQADRIFKSYTIKHRELVMALTNLTEFINKRD
ncbi:hypothetical protein AYI68_g4128 [Smittium mucronatum]|uniref:Myb/SANT-like DNA-binding domain-containing protein n=1 Tax=Smittium mucronatum TaxID=133383 RepID=A0A1R0GXY7_9FUNG|nr:hypothetical protein AYI68_g4128 [Smittium mucronatum]